MTLAFAAAMSAVLAALPTVAKTPLTVVTATPYPADSGSLDARCGRLIDGVSDVVRTDVTVVIRDGRIVAVAAGASAPQSTGVLDLRDYTCLPGLIDMHTHLADSPGSTADLSV